MDSLCGVRSPSIAALIPSYNRAHLLARAIDSVLAQSRQPDEIIVVDDGSTDGTPDVVAEYGTKVTLLRAPHGGVSRARNRGVLASGAEFIAFLDSDDYWDAEHVARLERAVIATGGVATLYFSDLGLSAHRGGGSIWARAGFSIDSDYELRADALDWLLLPRQPVMTPASMVRRDAYVSAGGCDERLGRREDTHLFFKLGLIGPLCAVSGVAGHATSDDPTSLNWDCGGDGAAHAQCTAWMYGDLLERMRSRRRTQRQTIARRLAAAELQLARLEGFRGGFLTLGHLVAAQRHDPILIPARLARRSRGAGLRLGGRRSPEATSLSAERPAGWYRSRFALSSAATKGSKRRGGAGVESHNPSNLELGWRPRDASPVAVGGAERAAASIAEVL